MPKDLHFCRWDMFWKVSCEDSMIEEWLIRAEKRVKAVNEIGFKRLLEEGNAHKSRLMDLGTSGVADGARVTHLNGRIEEFLHYVKTRMNRSHRIQAFFQSAQTKEVPILAALIILGLTR
ncbi:hypothetical protein ANCCEY_14285 [Ancylostoma ceylanicum]|uniref:Uncharacterized protein n=1 Tax=Ancylostoma ceylanicum TaxID=53326 RepID=A0A0D6LA62_9BILA|nr:hypothetical protein ANCCEY_14285 [Ancylostoma ceylanicum]